MNQPALHGMSGFFARKPGTLRARNLKNSIGQEDLVVLEKEWRYPLILKPARGASLQGFGKMD